jgi:hypothetical protein
MKFKQIFGSFPAFPVLFIYFHPLIEALPCAPTQKPVAVYTQRLYGLWCAAHVAMCAKMP